MRSSWIVSAILAIVPVPTAFAQQSHLDTRQQIEQMVSIFADRYNKQDAAAIATMFTTDAVRVSSGANAVGAGPQAIEEAFKAQFTIGFGHIDMTVDQVSSLGTDTAIAFGEYQLTGQAQGSTLKVGGHWTEVGVRDGGVWKIRLLTVVPTPNPDSNAVAPGTETNSGGADTSGTQKAAVLINIDKTNQKMTVFLDGVEKYDWQVSTGRTGYSTPSGTYIATSMNEIWYSKQWDNSPMPHSIFFMKDGHAIHGSYDVKHLGKPVSHGCVRISPENAATLYAIVGENGLENTQVVLTGVTPGGESKFARGQTGGGTGYFERSFGARYYRARQAYFGSPWLYSRGW